MSPPKEPIAGSRMGRSSNNTARMQPVTDFLVEEGEIARNFFLAERFRQAVALVNSCPLGCGRVCVDGVRYDSVGFIVWRRTSVEIMRTTRPSDDANSPKVVQRYEAKLL